MKKKFYKKGLLKTVINRYSLCCKFKIIRLHVLHINERIDCPCTPISSKIKLLLVEQCIAYSLNRLRLSGRLFHSPTNLQNRNTLDVCLYLTKRFLMFRLGKVKNFM